jgi:hypothetical protein
MAEKHDNMTGHQERHEHEESAGPGPRAFHEVYVTKDLGSERNQEIVAFIEKHITEYRGVIEEKHGIPLMLFEREQDAHKFASELRTRLNVPQEHITVKARKFTR